MSEPQTAASAVFFKGSAHSCSAKGHMSSVQVGNITYERTLIL